MRNWKIEGAGGQKGMPSKKAERFGLQAVQCRNNSLTTNIVHGSHVAVLMSQPLFSRLRRLAVSRVSPEPYVPNHDDLNEDTGAVREIGAAKIHGAPACVYPLQ